jgi:hypothetical protein
MSGQRYHEQADEFRSRASRARSDDYRRWAMYCAELLEAQAEMYDLYGRCPEVDLPAQPSAER